MYNAKKRSGMASCRTQPLSGTKGKRSGCWICDVACQQFYFFFFFKQKTAYEIHGRPAGSVMTIAFELEGQPFTALNGGPLFKFNEAISLQIYCDTPEEIDHDWTRLTPGGDPAAQQCGWLKD